MHGVYLDTHAWFEIYTRIYLFSQVYLLKICKNYIFESLNHDTIAVLKKIPVSDQGGGR